MVSLYHQLSSSFLTLIHITFDIPPGLVSFLSHLQIVMDPFPPPSMTLSPQSPPVPPPSNVNVFRPRRSDDWHEYREIIEQLYRIDQLKLRDVKRIMERDYKFFASYYSIF